MKALAIPVPGFEDVCAAEVQELTGSSSTMNHGVIIFEAKTLLDICSYIYRAHTPSKVIQVLAEGSADSYKKLIDVVDWSFLSGATFVVRADAPERQALESEIGGMIFQKTKAKVNLSHPDITIFVLVRKEHVWIGIDLTGEELGRRAYRVFLGSEALKGNVAASLVKLSGQQQPLVDLFCRNGVIPIEAALLAGKRSPHYFDKEEFLYRRLPVLAGTNWDAFFDKIDASVNETPQDILAMDPEFRNISATKKNAKIAGVIKNLLFSRTDLPFLDAKFGKQAIRTIVILPPQISGNMQKQKCELLLKDIFYQAEFVLKKGGLLAMITGTGVDALKQHANAYQFALEHERNVWQGASLLTVLLFRK